jgi:phospholipase/carboxylesterase
MSASIALTRPELTAGAVLMSGRILPEIGLLIARAEKLAGLPFLVVHGTEDTVLPVHNGRASRTLLTSLPVRLDYHEYPMGHTISPQSLDRPVMPQQARQHQS